MGTHLTFSAEVTQLGWSYGGDLSTALYPSSVEVKGGAGSCFKHVCISKTRWLDAWKKRLLWIFSRIRMWRYTHRPVNSHTKKMRPPFLSVFCSVRQLAHTRASSIISFLSVNLSPCLPTLSLSLFFSFSFSLPRSSSHFPSLHVPLSIVVICPVANSASVCSNRLCW